MIQICFCLYQYEDVLEASEELQSDAEIKAVDENAADLIAEAAEVQKAI
ncbi:MAG: hypothetical protein CM15mP91_1030 [Chloroflexota bacterium]|nr:MAG: hypothetical protein CM15mP91_1030 [Chloroflexota bacterium]